MSANPKKSFEFRMCKKVAELTQVVHMLFTRNHEKEVEIDALKKSYEHEIELVMKDARGRIEGLEEGLKELKILHSADTERQRQQIEAEMDRREAELRLQLGEAERLLQEERGECQNARDLLITAQRDIQKLRHGVTEQLSSKSDDIQKREREIFRLKAEVAALEARLKDSLREAQGVISELERTNERLSGEVRQLSGVMENSHKTRDQLLARNKQLEADMKALKREFNKKVQEAVSNQLRNSNKNGLSQDAQEELERLRREVQRYRLEISNRDNNFNRMFTEKQPMVVNQRNQRNQRHESADAMKRQDTIYTFTHSANNSGSHGHPAPGTAPSEENTSSSSALFPPPSRDSIHSNRMSRDRLDLSHLKNSIIDSERTVGILDRQMTSLPERVSTQERLIRDKRLAADHSSASSRRPLTQGHSLHERIYTNDKSRHSVVSSNGFMEESGLQLPRKPMALSSSEERPSSSSLPSLCSTPEKNNRRIPKFSKPKPLPRELLYGK